MSDSIYSCCTSFVLVSSETIQPENFPEVLAKLWFKYILNRVDILLPKFRLCSSIKY
jgi:hypothetical protein